MFKAAIETHAPQWTNIVGSKPVGDQELLTLDYSRLCCILWGKVSHLEARLAATGICRGIRTDGRDGLIEPSGIEMQMPCCVQARREWRVLRAHMCWWLLGAAHPLVVAVVIVIAVIVIVVLLVVIIVVVGGGS